MLSLRLKIIESLFRPFYRGLDFWPFSIRLLRHPLYRQIQFFYNNYFSHYYNFEQLVSARNVIILFCRGDRGSAEMEIIMSRDYEPEISSFILDHLDSVDYFFDVGSNIGFYSLLVAKNNPSINIECFEPVPETFSRLTKNLERNKFLNIRPNNFGLANINTKTDIFLHPDLGHSTLIKGQGSPEKITVRRADDIFDIKNKRIFIKIDTEGFEFEVLKGMEKLLSLNDCQIVLEFTPEFYVKHYNDINSPSILLSFLNSHGFTIQTIKEKTKEGAQKMLFAFQNKQ